MKALNCPILTMSDGYTIPQFGLGVFRSETGEETSQAVTWALEMGYRHIDTAMAYRNEADVAAGIRASGVPREEIFITSKLRNDHIEGKMAEQGILSSLKALDTDYIDLYLLHWPVTNFEYAWETLMAYQAKGKLRSIGVSNFQVRHLEKLEKLGLAKPVVNQIELHPSFQEWDLKRYCEARGMLIEAWSPLGGRDHLMIHDPVIEAIGEKYGKSGAQVIIRWHLQNGNIVFPKSVKRERIEQNAQVFDFVLSDEDMARINGLDTGERAYWSPDRWD